MDTVFRVQDEHGDGPYRRDFIGSEIQQMVEDHCDDDHPTPGEEPLIGRNSYSYEYCGFMSMEQLENWFSPAELAMLSEYGFEVVELHDVKITARGDKQCLFVRLSDRCTSRGYIEGIEF